VENVPASTWHWKVELPSSEEKVNSGVLSLVGPDGPESMDDWGGSVSTVKPRLAGSASVFPAASVALTSKV
jgi:hypothetical protein